MYTVSPIITYENGIVLPDCMYKVNNIHKENIQVPGPLQHLSPNCNNVSQQKQGVDMHKLEQHQLEILKKLADLKLEMLSLKENLLKECSINSGSSTLSTIQDLTPIVIFASPCQIPYSLIAIQNLWQKKNIGLEIKSYVHSSILILPTQVQEFIQQITRPIFNTQYTLKVTLIWKDVSFGSELVIGPTMLSSIKGEVNILRYLNCIAPGAIETASEHEMNVIFDVCFKLSRAKTQKDIQYCLRFLNAKLGKNTWICNTEHLSLVDIAVSSTLKQLQNTNDVTQNMTKWLQRCTEVVTY